MSEAPPPMVGSGAAVMKAGQLAVMPSSFARKSAPTGRLSATVRPARSATARPTK